MQRTSGFSTKIAGYLFFSVILGGLSIPCLAENTLSNDEAQGIIAAHLGYPIAVSKKVAFRENSRQMLDYLKKEGFIVSFAAETCCGAFYATTDKGKPYFGDMVRHFPDGELYVDCRIASRTIKSISKISVAPKGDKATVEYIEGLEPNEPVYSSVCKKGREADDKTDFEKTLKKKVRMKYSDNGWKIKE